MITKFDYTKFHYNVIVPTIAFEAFACIVRWVLLGSVAVASIPAEILLLLVLVTVLTYWKPFLKWYKQKKLMKSLMKAVDESNVRMSKMTKEERAELGKRARKAIKNSRNKK